MNDLSLVDKEYDLEDSNLKFLLALPESWDLKETIIRDNYNLDEITLDEIYGMLKTHELEMEKKARGMEESEGQLLLRLRRNPPKQLPQGKAREKLSSQSLILSHQVLIVMMTQKLKAYLRWMLMKR